MQPKEPSAGIRKAAAVAREVYAALIEQGFTTDEALQLVGLMLGAAAVAPMPGERR